MITESNAADIEQRIAQLQVRLLLPFIDELRVVWQGPIRTTEPVKQMRIQPGGLLQHILFCEPELAQMMNLKALTEDSNEPF